MNPGNNVDGVLNPEVSVIIPTYNRAGLVQDSIRSVLDQNYPSYEIVVVDDGSTDSTKETILSMSGHYPQIRYIYQDNGGPSTAKNRGLSIAKGMYIAFLDSDDLFEPEKIVLQVDYLMRNPKVGMVHSGFTKFNDAGDYLGYRDTSWFYGWVYPEMLLYWTTLIPPSTVMVRREVLDQVGGFDESLWIAEDLDLWRRIARVFPLGVIKTSLTLVRVHPGNSSGDTLTLSAEFRKYLQKAFEEDANLSTSFQRRSLSHMYSNAAYNLLNGKGSIYTLSARRDARCAIANDPWNLHGYFSLVASALPDEVRQRLVTSWRAARGYFMLRNREH